MGDLNNSILPFQCWVCGSKEMELAKRSNINEMLTSRSFAISDSRYGTTAEIHLCKNCGFLQCSRLEDVLRFYEDLEDVSYEEGRAARTFQAKKLLKIAQKYRPQGRLLDIGSGSGILVEQAIKMGYDAEGVEPSKWLQSQAVKHGLPVYLGTFPHPDTQGPYDVVTIIDVIEHVSDPVNLISDIRNVILEDGIIVVVTPDISSLMARILGWKWWHFRVAHIGYFNRRTLGMLLDRAGFRLLSLKRASWYFTADYLFDRVMRYLPRFIRISAPSALKKLIVPLNLGDSLLGVCALKE